MQVVTLCFIFNKRESQCKRDGDVFVWHTEDQRVVMTQSRLNFRLFLQSSELPLPQHLNRKRIFLPSLLSQSSLPVVQLTDGRDRVGRNQRRRESLVLINSLPTLCFTPSFSSTDTLLQGLLKMKLSSGKLQF